MKMRSSPARLLLIRQFLCNACWATPVKMHFDFCPLLRKTFAKIPLFADPMMAGGASEEKERQRPWCLALAQSLDHFWKLGCCMWGLFLETSESNVRQYQRQVQGCASRPWYLAVAKPHLRKLGCHLCRER